MINTVPQHPGAGTVGDAPSKEEASDPELVHSRANMFTEQPVCPVLSATPLCSPLRVVRVKRPPHVVCPTHVFGQHVQVRVTEVI